MKIKGGKVHKKNNHRPTTHRGFVLDRETPSKGYTHFISKRDVFDFLELVPNWRELMSGVEKIFLSAGDEDFDGQYTTYHRERTGGIDLAAWRTDLMPEFSLSYFESHRAIFERLNLKFEIGEKRVKCWFTPPKLKAYILLHIFLHELGHHHDRICSKQMRFTRGGEDYAENFALYYEKLIWPLYIEKFGKP